MNAIFKTVVRLYFFYVFYFVIVFFYVFGYYGDQIEDKRDRGLSLKKQGKSIMNQKTKRVLIVDDHEIVRTAIKHLLSKKNDIEVVGEAENGTEALNLNDKLSPEVLILDLKLPGKLDGMAVAKRLLRRNKNIKILVLTACEHNHYLSRLLKLGVSGYLTKGVDGNELVQAIREVYKGNRYLSPELAQSVLLEKLDANKINAFTDLSERELQIFELIVTGKKLPDIAEQLNLSIKSIHSYKSNLCDKLNVKNDVELTLLAIKEGLIHLPIANNELES